MINPRIARILSLHEFGQASNNVHKRLNGEFKDRLDGIRGINSDDSSIVHLMITYHNFFRPHTGIKGSTPAEAIGIEIEPSPCAESQSREDWITFIQNAALYTAAAAA